MQLFVIQTTHIDKLKSRSGGILPDLIMAHFTGRLADMFAIAAKGDNLLL